MAYGHSGSSHVPAVSITCQGTTFEELDDVKNIQIKGSILRGKIHVPDVALNLTEVKGDAIISKGILEGKSEIKKVHLSDEK